MTDASYSTEWGRKNRDRHRVNQRNWLAKNPEKRAQINKRKRESRATKNQVLKYLYGITLEQKEAMFEAQGKSCAICHSLEPGWKHNWAVDHCHRTKRVRAILCHSCNIVLGRVKEDVPTLKRMIAYLEAHNGSDSDAQNF